MMARMDGMWGEGQKGGYFPLLFTVARTIAAFFCIPLPHFEVGMQSMSLLDHVDCQRDCLAINVLFHVPRDPSAIQLHLVILKVTFYVEILS